MSITTTGAFGFWHAGQPVLMWQPMGAFGHWHAGQPLVWPVALPPEPPPPPSLPSGRAWAMERLQVGVEATPGVPVAPDLALRGVRLALQPEIEARGLRLAGARFAGDVVAGQEWSEGQLSGWPLYEELCYLLSALLGPARVSVPPGAAATRRWTWQAGQVADPVTFTVGQGQEAGALRAPGACLTSLSLIAGPDRLEVLGEVWARGIEDGVPLPEGVPLAGVPAQVGGVQVWAGPDAETLTRRRALGASLGLGRWRGALFGPAFVGLIEQAADAVVQVVCPPSESFFGVRALRLVAAGPLIEPGYRYQLRVTAQVALSRYWFADEGGLQAVGREFAVVSPAPGMGLVIEIDCPLEAF